MKIELHILEVELSIAKLTSIKNIDQLAAKSSFFALTKTDQEVSLVVDSENMPEHQYVNDDWKAIKMVGPLDFSLVGVLQQVIQPLAEHGISIFTISTFDTDYTLVKEQQLDRAIEILGEKFVIR